MISVCNDAETAQSIPPLGLPFLVAYTLPHCRLCNSERPNLALKRVATMPA